MKALIQRVSEASVCAGPERVGSIGRGILIFLGIEKGDSLKDLDYVTAKVAGLRIFEDEKGKMNLNVREVQGSVLVVSQFTLLADLKKGNRPSFDNAEAPRRAEELYNDFVRLLRETEIPVSTGRFGAYMKVSLVNDGPATFLVDSRK